MKLKPERLALLCIVFISCVSISSVFGIPIPQDEGDDEGIIEEEEAGVGDAAAFNSADGAVASDADGDAAAAAAAGAGAGASLAAPTGGRPPGLSNILESDGPGATVARADDGTASDAGETVTSESGEAATAGGEGAGAEGGASFLDNLKDTLNDNAGHVAVGGIGVVAIACVVGFSSKIISLLKSPPDISTISEQMKKLAEGKLDDLKAPNANGNAQDGSQPANDGKGEKKSKFPWGKSAAGSAAAKTKGGAGSNQPDGLKDVAAKKKVDVAENQSKPDKKAKKFLRKPDEIRSALKNPAGAAGAGAAAGAGVGAAAGYGASKLQGISEFGEDDLIGEEVSSFASRGEQNLRNALENPDQLKDLESIMHNPTPLETLGEIMKQPIQIEEIGKIVQKPEQLRQLESIMDDPSYISKLERSAEASDKMAEVDSVLGRAKVVLNDLEQQQQQLASGGQGYGIPSSATAFAAPASSALFAASPRGGGGGYDAERYGDATDSLGRPEKSEAITRLDKILEKYNDDGHYAEGYGRRSENFGGSGDNYQQGYGGGGGGAGDSRGSTLTRSGAYDQPYTDNLMSSHPRAYLGEESIQDIQTPPELEFDDDQNSSSFEDPRSIADSAKKQSRVPSGIPSKPTNVIGRVAVGGAAGAVAGGAMVAGKSKTGSPTVPLGKVVPAQSAVGAARKLPPPASRTVASRVAASATRRPASPQTTATVVSSRLSRPTKTQSALVSERERDDDAYSSGDDLTRSTTDSLRKVQFRADQYGRENYLVDQQGF